MKVALFHNASSGSEDHTDDELLKIIRRAGHDVGHVAGKVDALLEELQREPYELVVVAGGDGTVGRTACELAEWGVPIAILPLGTANNLALTLGMEKYSRKLAEAWQRAEAVPFDLATIDDGNLRTRFAEGVGWGVFARTIALAKSRPEKGRRRRRLERGREFFGVQAASILPRVYEIEVDGKSYSGDYLMVEVLNIPYIGARLQVSPESNPSDGRLEVVLARPSDRDALAALATDGVVSENSLLRVPAHEVRVHADEGIAHCDGHLIRHRPGARSFEVRVQAGAIRCLRP